MIRILKLVSGALVATALVACGGGGGSPGTNPNNPNPAARAADFTLSLSKASISNDGVDSAVLTVVAVDSNRNIVAEEPVTVSVGQNGVFVPDGTATDASGTFTGTVTAGTDRTARTMTITVTVNGVVKTITLGVTLPTTPPPNSTMTLRLEDGAGNALTNNSVTFGALTYASATVKDGAGGPIANKLVSFIVGSPIVVLDPPTGQVLTNASGVARVRVSPASISASGATTLTANATAGDVNLSAAIDIQTTAANTTLSNFVAAQTSLTAFQSTGVSVDVSLNGAPATSTPVTVSFSSNCGTFSPATATSNSTGKATTTFQAAGCVGGPATLTAAATGATPVQTTVTIQAPQPTNLLFVSATPSTIYSSVAAFGIKQSTVKFKVVDASGNGVGSSTNVRVSLSSSAIASGVVFADTNTTTPKVLSTDANGEVSVIVKSGAFPTPLALNAELVDNPAIVASSAGLSVNSGRPVQNFFSLSAEKYNIEGWSYDGESTSINILVADRLGQPIPEGTPISFITEGGQITASCLTTIGDNNKSGCSVTLISQAFRPTNGRVTLLAYMDGEEIFLDTNGNNRFDTGETFYDQGQPFLDINENAAHDAATEQKVGDPSVPGAGIGSSACAANPYLVMSVPNTCDGTWGATRVRASAVIVFSTSFASTDNVFSNTTQTGTTVRLSDQNGNAMPVGTTVTATISGGTNCTLAEVIPDSVPNAISPTSHRVIITKGSAPTDTCTGAEVTVKATTPKNNQTLLGSVLIP